MSKLDRAYEGAMNVARSLRNLRGDAADALSHASDAFGEPLEDVCFKVRHRARVKVDEILENDDYSAWGEIRPGELRDGEDLSSFRGDAWAARARTWKTPSDVPAIIIVETSQGSVIGDGRGRLNYAVGMGWKTLPVVFLTETTGTEWDVCLKSGKTVWRS